MPHRRSLADAFDGSYLVDRHKQYYGILVNCMKLLRNRASYKPLDKVN
jgi:hypothetical protein